MTPAEEMELVILLSEYGYSMEEDGSTETAFENIKQFITDLVAEARKEAIGAMEVEE